LPNRTVQAAIGLHPMPRTSRVVVPNYPHHVVHRGHDRNLVFLDDRDYQYYLSNIAQLKERFDVKVYAYCLMANHVHLLLSPGQEAALGLFMKRLAGRQTRFRNRLENRCGTLWDGRYKSSVVDKNQYLLACIRYIELNPVRAGITPCASGYQWSSFCTRLLGQQSLLDPVPGLESNVVTRDRYLEFVNAGIHKSDLQLIRDSLARGQLTGGDAFVDQIEIAIDRRIEHRKPGRPGGVKK